MNQVQRLPSFEYPPVIEVVASVQFDPLPKLGVVHLGLLWQRFRKVFPKVEQKPPIAPVVERLGVRAPLNQIQFQVTQELGVPRLWFVNEAGDELLQVQQDRFIRNWRAVPEVGGPYPRYDKYIKPKFLDDYRAFQQFLREEVEGEIEPNQCELTYINHIRPNAHWASHKDIASVFRGWSPAYSELLDNQLEAVNLRVVHVLNDAAGSFIGRLHVTLQSAFKARPLHAESDEPIFALTITARGRPTAKGDEGVSGFMDTAHRAIVTSFEKMTTTDMHTAWGKQHDT